MRPIKINGYLVRARETTHPEPETIEYQVVNAQGGVIARFAYELWAKEYAATLPPDGQYKLKAKK